MNDFKYFCIIIESNTYYAGCVSVACASKGPAWRCGAWSRPWPWARCCSCCTCCSCCCCCGLDDNHVPAHDFIVRSTGPRLLPARNSPPIAYFLLLFTVGTLRTVLTNTLAYATKLLDDPADVIQQRPSSRMRRWSATDLTMVNLKRYLGLCINTGLIKKKNVKDYWSRKNPSQYTPFFASVMSYRLFSFIQRVLHVGPIDAPARGQPNFDPWSKVRPVLDTINERRTSPLMRAWSA